jgi:hypothetical protein
VADKPGFRLRPAGNIQIYIVAVIPKISMYEIIIITTKGGMYQTFSSIMGILGRRKDTSVTHSAQKKTKNSPSCGIIERRLT